MINTNSTIAAIINFLFAIVFAALTSFVAPKANAQTTAMALTSSAESWVGGGDSFLVTPSDGYTFRSSSNYDKGISMYIRKTDNLSVWWSVDLSAPSNALLTCGPYTNATRYLYQSPTSPGLDLSGCGRGNNGLTGYFTVLDVQYASDNTAQSFAADFMQYDECHTYAWNEGSIRFNSTVPIPWTAYYDAAWAGNDVVDGFKGSFTTNNPGNSATGTLISVDGRLLPGITVSMTTNASSFNFLALGTTTNFTWPSQTDATSEFEGKIGRGYACELQGTAPLAMLTVTLAGLDPTKQYKLVVWCSRLADSVVSDYSNRLTDVTLLDVDSFSNVSSVAYNVTRSSMSMAQDTTTLPANLKYGYAPVARYEVIRPGTNGIIKFAVQRNASSSGSAYFNAFKLSESSVVGGDMDMDGMADTWEQQHFGSSGAATGGMLDDSDHDGSSNYDEYRAGTDPTNSSSRLALASAPPLPETAQTVLRWSGVAGKSYSLQNTTNLLQTWTSQYTGIAGVFPMNTHTVNTAAVPTFWRVKVE